MRFILLGMIHVYRWTISPLLGQCCRFYPSCSEYGLEVVKKHGCLKGGWLAVKRVVKCHPWHRGGYDPS